MAYARQSEEQYNQQQRERLVRNLKKRARQLGLEVSEAAASADAAVAGQ